MVIMRFCQGIGRSEEFLYHYYCVWHGQWNAEQECYVSLSLIFFKLFLFCAISVKLFASIFFLFYYYTIIYIWKTKESSWIQQYFVQYLRLINNILIFVCIYCSKDFRVHSIYSFVALWVVWFSFDQCQTCRYVGQRLP